MALAHAMHIASKALAVRAAAGGNAAMPSTCAVVRLLQYDLRVARRCTSACRAAKPAAASGARRYRRGQRFPDNHLARAPPEHPQGAEHDS
eukprot:7378619-Prymnesium_polylepis.2